MGLFNLRDKDKSCFRIFIELLKSARQNRGLSSDELADSLGLSRGTVIHHLNRLMDAGLVVHTQNVYILRVQNLQDLIEEVEKDIVRTLKDLRDIAADIDSRLA